MILDQVKVANRGAFYVSVIITGAIAGAFVWLVLFVMHLGLDILWDKVASWFGLYYPIVMCLIGGVVIGLFTRRYGDYPEGLMTVMAKVKRDGRYEYDHLGRMSVAALLPLIFGGSIGPEAGLTGIIAGLCSWVGDRMKRFGSDFHELTEAGVMATLSALFTAPLYGFVGGMKGTLKEDVPTMSKWTKALVYACAVFGAVGTLMVLTHFFGGISLPRYSWDGIDADEILWLIPLIIVGSIAGWLFCVSDAAIGRVSKKTENRLLKAVVAGLILGVSGTLLPFTMFSGELQIHELDGIWMEMEALLLFVIGAMKIIVTAMCVNMGWRGGHFFPLIFSGIALGYGMAMISGVDPVFCLSVVTTALVGGVMRKPLMTVLLLFLCFPIVAVLPMAVAAFVGSRIPLPLWAGGSEEKKVEDD